MSNLLNHGLSALMEACKQTKSEEDSDTKLMEAFQDAIDDDIIDAVMGNDMDDSVEADMDGDGVGDDSKMEELLAKIPPSDEDIDDISLESVIESCLPSSDELEC